MDNHRNGRTTRGAAGNGEDTEPIGPSTRLARPLKVLTAEQIYQIDDALFELGPFSEVRIIKAKGRVRFIQRVESIDASA